MSISNNLRQLRLDSGMTQDQAAEKLGVTRQALSSYETGRTRPDIDMLIRLCQVYDTDLDGVLYGQSRGLRAARSVKTAAVALLILITGLTLLSSSFLLSAHCLFPLAEGQLTQAGEAMLEPHLRLIAAWETTDKIILIAAFCGFAAIVLLMTIGKCVLPAKYKIVYMVVMTAAVLLAAIPFAAADPVFKAIDYLLTPLLVIGRMLFFFVVYIVIELVRNKKKYNPEPY